MTDANTSPPLTLEAELSLNINGQNLASTRRVALLAGIDRLGSITHAAKEVGLSYKGAWDAIEHMSNIAGEPLVERVAGGKGGGHTHLTTRGQQLVANFALIRQEHQRFIDRLNRQANGLTEDYALIEGIAMRTSARNQFAGTVTAIREGAVNDEIILSIIGSQAIVATVTREGRNELGLAPGAKAFALIKASSIIVVTDAGGARLSARNQLAGTVSRLNEGAVSSEVVLQLHGGGTVVATITNESARQLELAAGVEATAIFKASSVILGVAA
jgi:molybdate transport system regulatory protein